MWCCCLCLNPLSPAASPVIRAPPNLKHGRSLDDGVNLHRHVALATASSLIATTGPPMANQGHLFRKKDPINLFQLGVRHEVCTWGCADVAWCWELHLLHVIIHSPTLRSSWTQVSSAQRKGWPRTRFGLRCTTVLQWPLWTANRCARWGGGGGGFRLELAKVWEECSFPSQTWRTVKGPSL